MQIRLLMSMAPRISREERQAQTREELLAAAKRVFARRGYRGASVEEIADEAGYSHGAVYSNFNGKADLFLAVFEQTMANRVRGLSEARDLAEGSLPERARKLADHWMRTVTADREALLLDHEFTLHAARDPELSERFGNRGAATRTALQRFLEWEEQQGNLELPMPAEKLALLFSALGIGLALEWLNEPDAIPGGVYGDFAELLFTLMAEPG